MRETYETIVRRYLDYLRDNYMSDDELCTSRYKMREFLRHSICVGVGLKSSCRNSRIVADADSCADYILKEADLGGMTLSMKQGLLEACVHYMDEITRKVVV